MNFERLNARDLAIGVTVAFVLGGMGASVRGGGWGGFFIGGFGLMALFLLLAVVVAVFKKK